MSQKVIPESVYLALVKENERLKEENNRLRSLLKKEENPINLESVEKKPPESCW